MARGFPGSALSLGALSSTSDCRPVGFAGLPHSTHKAPSGSSILRASPSPSLTLALPQSSGHTLATHRRDSALVSWSISSPWGAFLLVASWIALDSCRPSSPPWILPLSTFLPSAPPTTYSTLVSLASIPASFELYASSLSTSSAPSLSQTVTMHVPGVRSVTECLVCFRFMDF